MNELWQRMVAGAAQISSVIPALVGAFVILMTGYFLARQVQRWADETLKRLRFDRMVSAGGFDEVVDRAGLRLDPVRALAKLIFWLVMLVVILLASTALGLHLAAILAGPIGLVGCGIVLGGVVGACQWMLVRTRVRRPRWRRSA